jgi:hypothetical protein
VMHLSRVTQSEGLDWKPQTLNPAPTCLPCGPSARRTLISPGEGRIPSLCLREDLLAHS